MLETPHAVVGAAIAIAIPNPLISLPLAFASHFVLDIIPHSNPHIYTEVSKKGKLSRKTISFIWKESTLAAIVGISLAVLAQLFQPGSFFVVLAGAFAGTLGDLLEMPYYFLNSRGKLMTRFVLWQRSIQEHTDTVYGNLTQIIITLAGIWWILTLLGVVEVNL